MPETPRASSPGERFYFTFAQAAYRQPPEVLSYRALAPYERSGWEAVAVLATEQLQDLANVTTLEALAHMLTLLESGASPADAYTQAGLAAGVLMPPLPADSGTAS